MKKVININFQGRVTPIEETAYDMLTKYVESLRVFFANEEGRDEIINDIEGRIAELFGEILKKGNTCIVESDVQTIISSMGRPEDFEAEEGNLHSQLGGEKSEEKKSYQHAYNASGNKKLFRNETNKVFGGVCAGIADYFGIDTLIVRILFILFGGLTFWIYFILWIAVPATSSQVIGSQRKRLFRDPDNKLIAGVCSGLAQYFGVQVWIPRVLFLIPFFSFVFQWGHWGWWDFPNFLSFSFSPGSLFIYIIFWLVLPEAKSAADKLEMKGEKVDLNNIKSTIQGDMEGFKDRAKVFGNEIKEKAQEFGDNLSKSTNRFASEATTVARSSGGGIGRAIAMIVKIFVYFILGSLLFGLVAALFGVGVAFTGLLPAYSYVLDEGFQKLLSWGALIFFVWVPVIAVVTWIIRRLTGKRGNSGIIKLTFAGLWILGWICFINLIITLRNEFRYRNYPTEQTVSIANPTVNKLEIKTAPFGKYYTGSWLRMEPFASFDEDTVYVRNIRLRIVKSDNDSFKVVMVKMANASTKTDAERIANRINFSAVQKDSVLILDRGISITRQEKFRNQQVIITVAVPVGKRILVNDNVGWGNDVRVDFGRNDDYWDWENSDDAKTYDWDRNVEYIMTVKGLERVNKDYNDENDGNNDEDEDSRRNALDQFRKSKDQLRKEMEQKQKELEQLNKELQAPADSTLYRYNQPPQEPAQKKDKAVTKTSGENAPNGMNDTAVMKYAL